MEIEYFISPDSDWNKIFEDWVNYIHGFADLIGLNKKNFYDDEIKKDDLAFYSKRTIDMEYKFPFSEENEELWAVAYRTDYDLTQHQKGSGQSMEYFDDATKTKYIPHVIEPTFGVDRTLLALLSEAYCEEGEGDDKRTVLKLKPNMAPYKIAVAPLLGNKEKLAEKAREIYGGLKKKWNCVWDDRGNIGKRYRSQDEIGTPYFIVVDFESLEDGAVTVRDRDTTKQERIKIDDLEKYFEEKLN
jgi:glycyl-tRNA synthetase